MGSSESKPSEAGGDGATTSASTNAQVLSREDQDAIMQAGQDGVRDGMISKQTDIAMEAFKTFDGAYEELGRIQDNRLSDVRNLVCYCM
jgi:hypothetical protein